jgi:RNA polymerase sigma-70 factor (ECF subfamily)
VREELRIESTGGGRGGLTRQPSTASFDAAEEFVRRLHADHGDAIFGWAARRFGDIRDAEEVVAETLVRAWRFHHTYDPDLGSERTWIFGIARNTAVDHFRRQRRHLRLVEPGSDVPELEAEDAIERIAEASVVTEVLAGLPDHQREAVVETYFRGRTIVQAAEQLGIPPGTVKSRLFYGLRAMRTALEERGVLR